MVSTCVLEYREYRGITDASRFAAYIESVRSVLDPNPMPPGLYQYSVVVSTPQREMKITAPTKERHDIWLNVGSSPFGVAIAFSDRLLLRL